MLVGSNLNIAPCALYPEVGGGLVFESVGGGVGLGVGVSLHLETRRVSDSSHISVLTGEDGYSLTGEFGGILEVQASGGEL